MSINIQQSTTTKPLLFKMVDSTDHVTPETGLSPTVTLSKNGGAFAAHSGEMTELANGWYSIAGNATDTNTLGSLILHAEGVGSDNTDVVFQIVGYSPDAALDTLITTVDTVVDTIATDIGIIDANVDTIATDVWAYDPATNANTNCGGYLANVKSRIGLLPMSLHPTLYGTLAVANQETITLVAGDDYTDDTTPVSFTSAGWADLTDGESEAVLTMVVRDSTGTLAFTVVGAVVTAGTGTQEIEFEVASTDTAAIEAGNYSFGVKAVWTTFSQTLVLGTMTITEGVTIPV